jgi:hypothetical protein
MQQYTAYVPAWHCCRRCCATNQLVIIGIVSIDCCAVLVGDINVIGIAVIKTVIVAHVIRFIIVVVTMHIVRSVVVVIVADSMWHTCALPLGVAPLSDDSLVRALSLHTSAHHHHTRDHSHHRTYIIASLCLGVQCRISLVGPRRELPHDVEQILDELVAVRLCETVNITHAHTRW